MTGSKGKEHKGKPRNFSFLSSVPTTDLLPVAAAAAAAANKLLKFTSGSV